LFNFASDQGDQLGDLLAVEVPRMREGNENLPANPSRVRVQYDDSVRQAHGFADGVGDKQDRFAGSKPEFLNLLVEQGAGLGVERGKRFIHQQNRRVHDQGAGDGDALPHSTGQLVNQFAGAVGQVNHLQRIGRAILPLAPGNAGHFQPEFDIRKSRKPGEQAMFLKDHRPVRSGPGDRFAIERRAADIGFEHSRSDVEQRALAASAGTNDDDKFARLNGDAHPSKGRDSRTLEVLVDVAQHQPASQSGGGGRGCWVGQSHSFE
jgi:hypothetical protein